MPRFMIEREIPGGGSFSGDEWRKIAQRSCSVLGELGPQVQWVRSLVTDDKMYCEYIAPDEASVRRHAEMGGFPANSILRVARVVDPTTSE